MALLSRIFNVAQYPIYDGRFAGFTSVRTREFNFFTDKWLSTIYSVLAV